MAWAYTAKVRSGSESTGPGALADKTYLLCYRHSFPEKQIIIEGSIHGRKTALGTRLFDSYENFDKVGTARSGGPSPCGTERRSADETDPLLASEPLFRPVRACTYVASRKGEVCTVIGSAISAVACWSNLESTQHSGWRVRLPEGGWARPGG